MTIKKIHIIKLTAEIAKYMIFNDLSQKWLVHEDEIDMAITVLRRNQGEYTLKNGDKIMYHNRGWILKRT